jgi:hypothetical protein
VQNITKIAGVDVMITIFCDFCQYSAKQLALFSKTNVMITFKKCYDHILAKSSSSLSKKRHYVCHFFVENIFKIITSVPGMDDTLNCAKYYKDSRDETSFLRLWQAAVIKI